ESLEHEHRAALGLMLDIVRHEIQTERFNAAIEACRDSIPGQAVPLFEVQSSNQSLRRLAEKNATPVSRAWNLHVGAIELKQDAIRPPLWVMQQNPGYRDRAEFKGDLRC